MRNNNIPADTDPKFDRIIFRQLQQTIESGKSKSADVFFLLAG